MWRKVELFSDLDEHDLGVDRIIEKHEFRDSNGIVGLHILDE